MNHWYVWFPIIGIFIGVSDNYNFKSLLLMSYWFMYQFLICVIAIILIFHKIFNHS